MLQCKTTLLLLAATISVLLLMPAHAQPEPAHDDHGAALKNPDGSWKYTNALIHETSPYLLQHAHNPVDWMPWGEAAFERARREQKPIFLSVGYSTCYWCHVMERQVFEDPELAELVNEKFVCIKVDREERPDVDSIYMTATQVMTRSGGWPMNVFLTPPAPEGTDDATPGYGLRPYYCATYIPPAPMQGRPGFAQVINALSGAWETRRQVVLEQAEQLAQAVIEVMAEAGEQGPLTAEQPRRAAETLKRIYDPEHGGFGGAPKFPQPAQLELLLAYARTSGDDQALEMVLHTLDRMARGGMFDQVGGGFHRYSVDERWLVPHFEKMLYDNGQLLSLYAHALDVLREQGEGGSAQALQCERVLRETADYLLAEMTDETGAFWSAQDAEVNAREGENYLWTRAQIEAALGDEELAALAVRLYGLAGGPNFQDPHDPAAGPTNVLYLPTPVDQLAEQIGITADNLLAKRGQINAQLKQVRDTRDQPGTDDKVLVSWNGLAIKGLAEAGAVLDEPRYTEAAKRAADAILSLMTADEGGLYRTMRTGEARVPGFLEDYTHLSAGLIALARLEQGGGDAEYLGHAKRLTQLAIDRFAAGQGGYYDTLPDQADLFVRVRSAYDGAVPTGNSVMVQNLVDLSQMTGERAWLDRAVVDLRSFASSLDQQGAGQEVMQAALIDALSIDAVVDRLAAASGGVKNPGPVTVSANWADDGTLVVSFEVAEGLHLNAHEVGDEFLIPTSLELVGAGELKVEYPDGELKRFPFADQPIRVYEGRLTIRAALTGTDAGSRLRLTYQACNDAACLPPADVAVPIPER